MPERVYISNERLSQLDEAEKKRLVHQFIIERLREMFANLSEEERKKLVPVSRNTPAATREVSSLPQKSSSSESEQPRQRRRWFD